MSNPHATRTSLMGGIVTESQANELAERLGLPVERVDFVLPQSEASPEISPETRVREQQAGELF